jgi:hypothetical protein
MNVEAFHRDLFGAYIAWNDVMTAGNAVLELPTAASKEALRLQIEAMKQRLNTLENHVEPAGK